MLNWINLIRRMNTRYRLAINKIAYFNVSKILKKNLKKKIK